MMNYPVKSWAKLMPSAQCPECGRIFDLFDQDDAVEWFEGHDCEVE